MIDKSNHGKVGKCLYMKFSVDVFNNLFNQAQDIKDGDIYSVEECDAKFRGMTTSVPIHIDNNIQGDYEAVCEFGTEIHEFED